MDILRRVPSYGRRLRSSLAATMRSAFSPSFGSPQAAPKLEAAAIPPGGSFRQTLRDFSTLSKRGVRPLLVYGDKDMGLSYFNHYLAKSQQDKAVSAHVIDGVNHAFSYPDDARRLMKLLSSHLEGISSRKGSSKIQGKALSLYPSPNLDAAQVPNRTC